MASDCNHFIQVKEQTLVGILSQRLIINGDQKILIVTMKENVLLGKGILPDVPPQHTFNLSTGRRRLEMLRMPPMMASPTTVFRTYPTWPDHLNMPFGLLKKNAKGKNCCVSSRNLLLPQAEIRKICGVRE